MLAEIESRLVAILQENLDLPVQNISTANSSKSPAIVISNLKFKFRNNDISENLEQQKAPLEESFSGDGVKKIFKLQETPLRSSVTVECPVPSALKEKADYVVNYENCSVIFLEAPKKGKNNIMVRYTSRRRTMTMKAVRVKSLYSIEVAGKDYLETDSLTEKVIKALLCAEEEFLSHGIEIKPLGGALENLQDPAKIQLKYVIETELRIEKIVEPVERIQISRKNP